MLEILPDFAAVPNAIGAFALLAGFELDPVILVGFESDHDRWAT